MTALGYRLTSGGTDNHLFVVDLRPQGLTGNKATKLLDAVHITISKSMIPYDPEKPWITSGIRIGTPALTTRGFTPDVMPEVAKLIDRALKGEEATSVHKDVVALARQYPMP
jgi:glycine hydroxymethyltransferase